MGQDCNERMGVRGMVRSISRFRWALAAVLGLWFILQVPLFASAEDVRVEALIDRRTVELGSFCELTLKVHGTQSADPVTPLKIDGFQTRYVGPATNISIANGEYSSSISFRYNLYPLHTGRLRIPPITMTVQGRTYETQPIEIDVVESGSSGSSVTGAPRGDRSLKDDLFLTLDLGRQEVYVGERIPVTLKLFIHEIGVRNIQYPQLDLKGFRQEAFQKERQYRKVVGGVEYHVVEFRTAVVPEKTGDLVLGPARLECSVLFERPRPTRSSGGVFDIFDDDFLEGFFTSYTIQPLTVTSPSRVIRVRPLPEEGRPEDFSGGVGRFDLSVTVGPQKVAVGDPVTVKMTLTGTGDLKSVTLPAFDAEDLKKDFKVYDPEVNDLGDKKVLEQVIIPRHEGVKEVPSVSLSYFDPQEGRYKRITRGPFRLSVGPAAGGGLKVVGDTEPGRETAWEEPAGEDLVFIKQGPGGWRRTGSWTYRSRGYVTAVLASLFLWTVLVGFHRFTRRLRTDEHFVRRLRAPRKARAGLLQARRHLEEGREAAFYDALFKTLQGYFGDKCRLPAGEMTIDAVRALGRRRGVDPDVLDKAGRLFNECEQVRYASVRRDPARMKTHYRWAEEIIDTFERSRG